MSRDTETFTVLPGSASGTLENAPVALTLIDSLSPLLHRISERLLSASPDLVERFRDVFERRTDFAKSTLDGDWGSATGTDDRRIVLEPSDWLLELAAALGATDISLPVKHGTAP